MAHIWYDQNAAGAASGASTDDAYSADSSLAQTFAGSNHVWIRRATAYTLAATRAMASSSASQIARTQVMAWPRPSRAGTGNWVQGSRVIAEVGTIVPVFASHVARYIKNDADGKWYLITAIACKVVFSAVVTAPAKYEKLTCSGGAVMKVMHYDAGTTTAWCVVASGTPAGTETVTGDGKVQEGAAKTAAAATIGSVDIDNGFVILSDYAGTAETGGATTIKADPLYDYAQTLVGVVDATWTTKLTEWNADADTMPIIDGSTNAYRLDVNGYYMRLQGVMGTGGGGSGYGSINIAGFGAIADGCIVICENNARAFNWSSGTNPSVINSVVVGTGNAAHTTNDGLRGDNMGLIRNCAFYGMGNYGINCFAGQRVEDCNFGVELDNGNYDVQTQSGITTGFDVQCGGKAGTIRSSTYDSTRASAGFHNWQRVLGANIKKVNNGYVQYATTGTDPGTPPSGGTLCTKVTLNESANYVPADDINACLLMEWAVKLSAGANTIKLFLQNNGFGNINTSDVSGSQHFWFEVIGATQRVSDSVYKQVHDDIDPSVWPHSTSSANPIPDRGDADDWDDYLTCSVTMPADGVVLVRLFSRIYDADGIIYFDVPEVT